MYVYFAVCFSLLGILRPVNSLSCYVCDSQTNADCNGNPLGGKKFVQTCPNPSDICGMSYTSNIETLERIGFNRSCLNSDEQKEISSYGPDQSVRKKEKDSKNRYFELVQVTYSTCNESLCNTDYESDSDYLKCYTCSSSDAVACDYEGTTLVSMNNTFLSRCPDNSYQCASSYKMEPGGTISEVEVSRYCISEGDLYNKRRIFGDKLVGTENNSSKIETHLFVCNTTGCNLAFPDEYLPISCFVCNDVSEPDCDLDGSKLSDDSKLLKLCPDSSPQYCMMWYKVDLHSSKTQSVVRSCVSKEEALRYKNTYGRSLSGIYAKMDYLGKASYQVMTICGSSGCNVKFPKYSPADVTCYVCSEEDDSSCTLDGQKLNADHLKACDNTDDICTMSYRVQVDAKTFGNPLSIARKCVSREHADMFLDLYGDEHDVAVFEEDSAPGVDIYMYFCYFPQCNRQFPAEHEEMLSVRPPLRCYNCQMSNEKNCIYEMTEKVRSFIVVCPNTEDYRCFMSYEIKSTGDDHYNINRTCAPATEILHLKDRYGKSLIALQGESDGGPVELHMFHCHYPLCNLHFPDSNRTAISCYECTQDDVGCDLEGDKLTESDSSLLMRCPSHDPHVCVLVVRHNSETNEVNSIVRKCMPSVQADFYEANYGKPTMFLDSKDTNVRIFMAFCKDDACNKDLAKQFAHQLVRGSRPDEHGEAAGRFYIEQDNYDSEDDPLDPVVPPGAADLSRTVTKPQSNLQAEPEAAPALASCFRGWWLALAVGVVISTFGRLVGTNP